MLYFGGSDDALGVSFDNPKPVAVASKIIEATCGDGDIVLDFFAGSATTAQACMEVSCEENRMISFILVQLPEAVEKGSAAYKKGFHTISELSRERIVRAANEVSKSKDCGNLDGGFRAFELDQSNIKLWNPDRNDLEASLLSSATNLLEGRSEDDLLCELMLKRGIDLSSPTLKKSLGGKTIYSVGYGVLFACLDSRISQNEIETIAEGILAWHKELEPETDSHVFFRDSAFADDIAKTNMAAILEQNGISHVRSL